jgi:hypothetical protein
MNQCCICIYHICCIICYIQLIIYCTTPQSGSTHMSRKPIPLPLFDVPQPCPGMNCGSIYLFTQNTVICFYYMGKKKKKPFLFLLSLKWVFSQNDLFSQFLCLDKSTWLCFRLLWCFHSSNIWLSQYKWTTSQSSSDLTFWTELRRQSMDLVWKLQEELIINRNHKVLSSVLTCWKY